jgi:heme-degrading monooxygenase HmoA
MQFEAAFASVASLLVSADGHISHRLVAAVDHADLFLLEVEWRDLAAHTEHFEPSSAHAEFIAALEPFFVGEPIVLHVRTFSGPMAERDPMPQ